MKYLFKLLGVISLLLALILSPLQSVFADLSGDDALFIVTAYYSPLPGQNNYATGSYAGDIRLNGGGKVTASGLDVFEGLLAAPSGYDYGTKIHFKGYGVGQVEDRGGAIVKAGTRGFEHDRIDLWMGHGDEGLYRALNWGKRTIEGKVVSPDTQTSITLGKTFLGKYGGVTVGPDSPELNILKLQELFIEVDLYNGEIDGKYESIEKSIIDFQIQMGIIDSRDHDEAGYFGNKTRTALRENFDFSLITKEDESVYTKAEKPAPLTTEQKIIAEYDGLEVSPEASTANIIKLQTLFKDVGLYQGSINGRYASIEDTLIDFQIKTNVVSERNGWGAGHYGEKTRAALFSYFSVEQAVVETINNKTGLSAQEIQELDTLVGKLKIEINKIADAKNQRSSDIFDQLSERIDLLLERDISSKLRAKLLYIQENI